MPQVDPGSMFYSQNNFGIRLKPQMDKGNFILRPTLSLGLLAQLSARVVEERLFTENMRIMRRLR